MPDQEGLLAMQQGGIPEDFNMFVRIEFVDANIVKRALALHVDDETRPREINGKMYLESRGFLVHVVNETMVELGTELYVTQETRRMFTDNLNAAFQKMPDAGLRIAADLEGLNMVVSHIKKLATESTDGDPMAAALIGVVDNMKDIRICADLDDKNLFSIAMTGKSPAEAEELRGALDGLLGFAKLMGGGAAAEIPDPEMSKMVGEILSGLQAEQSGNDVMIQIARPSNFDAAVKSLMPISGDIP